jgi:hypothetical protein
MDLINVILIVVGTVVEITLLLKYKVLNGKLKKLNGTGRMRDIEITLHNKMVIRVLLVSIPVLLVIFLTDFLNYII